MASLSNHLILYDAECPMCRLYTSAFVKAGMLDQEGRAAYQQEQVVQACPQVDLQRAVNEIALVNRQTGEVTYGIQSLFTVLGTTMPFFRPLFAFRPFIAVMRRVYAFISYNRRVIIPAPATAHSFAVQPAFRKDYRIVYLLFTWLVTASILSSYTPLLTGVVPASGFYREFLICGGQIIFQGIIVGLYARHAVWHYLGNMMTVSLAGALLLLPALALNHWIAGTAVGYSCYFMLVAGFMFLEHIRRTQLLGLNWLPTITWALYRVLVLCVLLYTRYYEL